jgi:UDP-N-acetylglucosamine 2-epimerase (non-hydrolysing)
MTRVATVFGTRPEIIKLSMYIEEMDKKSRDHFLIHTNQHYDYEMDAVFMEELDLRAPNFRLDVKSANQATQMGGMISELGRIFGRISPEVVTVLGDTNSTLAGAIAAKKLGIRLAHIEAGCRSFDSTMPEEQNRIVADHLADILFAPTNTCVENLKREGLSGSSVCLVGSTLTEVCKRSLRISQGKSAFDFTRPYALMTIHRRSNIEDRSRLSAIVHAMVEVSKTIPVVFPVHPHTRKSISQYGLGDTLRNLHTTRPLGYLDFLKALSGAEFVLTDSGGVQQEAQILNVPILTARNCTEWVETVRSGGCILVDADEKEIVRNAIRLVKNKAFAGKLRKTKNPYVETKVSKRIVARILQGPNS